MRRDEEGDGLTSDDRNVLRVVASYGATAATAGEASRSLGISRQAAAGRLALLARLGFLESRVLAQGRCYMITGNGLAELKEHEFAYLLVKADDRMAGYVTDMLAHGTDGIKDVTEHGGGCCCPHCPHGGKCCG